MATFEIFAHLDVVGRQGWQGDPDERPLTDIGWRQAEKIADELLADGPVDAVYASNNTRCRQSVEPLAKRLGQQVTDVFGFGPAPRPSGEADPLAPAYQAGTTLADMVKMSEAKPDGRFVVCANGGDIITSLTAFAAGRNGQPIPPKLEVSIGPAGSDLRRGNIYTLIIDGDKVSTKQREASADFPQAVPSPA